MSIHDKNEEYLVCTDGNGRCTTECVINVLDSRKMYIIIELHT